MFSAIGRILVVTFAFALAMAAGVFVAFRIGLEWMTLAGHGQDPSTQAIGALRAIFDFLMSIFALQTLAFIPLLLALAIVIVGEVARIRSALFYIAGAGLAAAAIPLLLKGSALHWQVFATAGFASGAIYWALAGRKA